MPSSGSSLAKTPRHSPFPISPAHRTSEPSPRLFSPTDSEGIPPVRASSSRPATTLMSRTSSHSSGSGKGHVEYQPFKIPDVPVTPSLGPYGEITPPIMDNMVASSSYTTQPLNLATMAGLGNPFSFDRNRVTLTSPVLSSSSSVHSPSPDQAFVERFGSPDPDLDDDEEGKPDRDMDPPLGRAGKTPRPPNAWILYRSDKIKAFSAGEEIPGIDEFLASRNLKLGENKETEAEEADGEPINTCLKKTPKKPIESTVRGAKGLPQAEISRLIAFMWKKENKAVKSKYDRLAEVRKMEHQRKFPDYKYQPMRKEDKIKLKEERERDRALARKERALEKAMKPRKARVKPKKSVTEAESRAQHRPPPVPSYLIDSDTPSSSTRSHLVTPRSPNKSGRSVRKMPSSHALRGTKAKGRKFEPQPEFEEAPFGLMDGNQVFWGVPPELPISYVVGNDGARAPRDMAEVPTDVPHGGRSFSVTQRTNQEEDLDFNHGIAYGSEGTYDQANNLYPAYGSFTSDYGYELPPPEAGLAIDSKQVVPYIFEPMPFPVSIPSSDQSGRYQFLPYDMSRDGDFNQTGEPSDQSQRDPLQPTVHVPGVTESELAEMWGLLEDETVGLDFGHDNGADLTQSIWAADPSDIVDQWANLGGPIDDNYSAPRTFSGSVAGRIAMDWAHQNQSQAPARGGQSQYASQNYMGYSQGVDGTSIPSSNAYPSSRPGYVTIEVPVDALAGSYQPPSSYLASQGPALSAMTPLSPVNGAFNSEGWPMMNGQSGHGSHLSFSLSTNGQNDSGSQRGQDYASPFSAPGMPLDHRYASRYNSGSSYIPPPITPYDTYHDRRVSEGGIFECEPSIGNWADSPSFSETNRIPSFADYQRVPSNVSFPELEIDQAEKANTYTQSGELPEHKRFAPVKKSRVVAAQHVPSTPQPVPAPAPAPQG